MRYFTVLIGIAILFAMTTSVFALQDSSGKDGKSYVVKEKTVQPEMQSGLNSEYQAIYDKAITQFDAKVYDETITLLTQVISAYPNYIPAYKTRGLAFMEKGKITKSKLDKDIVRYNKSIYEYQKAVKDFSKIIKLDPSLEYAYLDRAISYVGLDYYGQPALDDLDKYINDFGNGSIDAYYYRGVAHLQRGFLPEAESDLQKVIEMDPNHADAYATIMRAYDTDEDYNAAIEYFGKLIKQHPDNALPWFYRGLAYLQNENYKMAIADFDKALAIYPDYTEAQTMRNEAKRY